MATCAEICSAQGSSTHQAAKALMAIQWFPGHMRAAHKKAGETMVHADVIVEVLDARLPEASSNPMIKSQRLLHQRPCLKLLNKADLADPNITHAWLKHLNAQKGVTAIAISCKKVSEVSKVPALCEKLVPHRGSLEKPLRLLIMGIPNVGKSTFMNTLVKRRVAAVGDEPAITKTQQRIDISDTLYVIDTPGMMWPKIEHDSDGMMLAASHAIGRNAVIDEEVATFLAGILLKHYPARLAERYKLDTKELDAVGVVEGIAKRRGMMRNTRHGKELDYERASLLLLQDYRDGELGRISLETPQSRAAMLAADAAAAEERRKKKEAKLAAKEAAAARGHPVHEDDMDDDLDETVEADE